MDDQALGAGLRCSSLTDVTVLSLRHQAGDEQVLTQELDRAGLPWPRPQELARVPAGGWMVRLSPFHSMAVSREPHAFAAAIQRLAPGRQPAVMAIDTSEGHRVLELRGKGIETLMRRVMDTDPGALAGPVIGGARVADVTAIVVRQDTLTWCLVVERPFEEHVRARLRVAAQAAGIDQAGRARSPEPGHQVPE